MYVNYEIILSCHETASIPLKNSVYLSRSSLASRAALLVLWSVIDGKAAISSFLKVPSIMVPESISSSSTQPFGK